MALTELRNKQNPWFEKRNHVRPAKNQVSKMYIDSSLGGGGGPTIPDNVLTLENGVKLRNVYDASDAASIQYGVGPYGNPDEITWTSTVYGDMGTAATAVTNVWEETAGDPVVPVPLEIVNGRLGLALDSRSAPVYPKLESLLADGGVGYSVAWAMCFTKQPGDAADGDPRFFGENRNPSRGGWWNPDVGSFSGFSNSGVDGVPASSTADLSANHVVSAGNVTYGISGFGNRCHAQGYTDFPHVFNGHIHEILLYESETTMTANDHAAIYEYFQSKWSLAPHQPDRHWDASKLSEGMINEWVDQSGVNKWEDAVTAVPVVTVDGRRGVRFHQDDHAGPVYPQWRSNPNVGAANGTWIIAITHQTPNPANYRNQIGNDATYDRGARILNDAVAGETTGGISGDRRTLGNFTQGTSDVTFAAMGVTSDTEVFIIGFQEASRIWLHLGNRLSSAITNCANGVFHEILYWDTALTEQQFTDVANYLNTKWGFGLTP